MLDRASLRTLSQHPERNAPVLNVALAEEGDAEVLFALVASPGVGADALAKIAARVASEGEEVGYRPEPSPDDDLRRGSRRASDEEPARTNGSDLDARLVVHPRSDDAVRDAILARHPGDAFFALAAASHASATPTALDLAARWPCETPLHERPWLALIDASAVPPLLVDGWRSDDDPLAREAAAVVLRDAASLAELALDPSRQVRRAVASNPFARALHASLRERDSACEVRARAAAAARADEDVRGSLGVDVTSARFVSALAAMKSGGVVLPDVARAMRTGSLDAEGARLAARALDASSVATLVSSRALHDEVGVALAAGIALRDHAEDDESRDLVGRCVHALAGADRTGGVLTGKGRFASWLAEGIVSAARHAEDEVVAALGRVTLAADRMVLGRVAAGRTTSEGGALVARWAARAASEDAPVPIALLELAWRRADVDPDTLTRLSQRVLPVQRTDASPENEVDLDPRARPLDVLERIGVALVGKAPLSPRAALALTALEPRRVRYVLSAMPQWKGVLAGVNVARVLKAHAGALSAAPPSGRRPPASAPAGWTQRRLDEVELAVALAIRDLSPSDAVARLGTGQDSLLHGTALAAAMEARAAIDGEVKALEPLVEWLSRARSKDAASLAAWLVIEGLDRARSAATIAAALDAPWAVAARAQVRTTDDVASRAMVAPGIAEALATLERRTPGRLAEVMPQTPRGRAALVSGIARAYRALGGMSVTES